MKFKRVWIAAIAAIAVAVLFTPLTARAENAQAKVNVSALNFRHAATTKSKVLAVLRRGEKVEVLGKDGNWSNVLYKDKKGWVYTKYITITKGSSSSTDSSESSSEKKYEESKIGIVTASSVNFRSSPKVADNNRMGSLRKNTKVTVIGEQSGWYHVVVPDGRTAWMYAQYISISSSSSSSSRGETTEETQSARVADILKFAKAQLGKPYVYGASGPKSFDCTGFVTYVFKHFGYSLPRTAKSMGYGNWGTKLTRSKLKAGDIVFFNTIKDSDLSDHAGIYLGDGEFIHCSSSKSNGRCVRISSLDEGYYKKVFSWGRRVPGLN